MAWYSQYIDDEAVGPRDYSSDAGVGAYESAGDDSLPEVWDVDGGPGLAPQVRSDTADVISLCGRDEDGVEAATIFEDGSRGSRQVGPEQRDGVEFIRSDTEGSLAPTKSRRRRARKRSSHDPEGEGGVSDNGSIVRQEIDIERHRAREARRAAAAEAAAHVSSRGSREGSTENSASAERERRRRRLEQVAERRSNRRFDVGRRGLRDGDSLRASPFGYGRRLRGGSLSPPYADGEASVSVLGEDLVPFTVNAACLGCECVQNVYIVGPVNYRVASEADRLLVHLSEMFGERLKRGSVARVR
jgi:hypothetical protein